MKSSRRFPMGMTKMDRNEYLMLCKKCSEFKPGPGGVKNGIPKELRVLFGETEYYPEAYELSFYNGEKVIHTAILHDLKANSITRARLEMVRPAVIGGGNGGKN